MTQTFFHTPLPALLALLALSATVPAYPESRNPEQYFFQQSFNNLQEEADIARQQHLTGVFVMFSADDCPWCQKMKANVLSQPVIQDYYRRHFRILHIDIRGDTPVTTFAGDAMSEKDFAFRVNRVRATPVFMFFDLDGHPLQRFTGASRDVDEFLWLAEFVVSGEYRHLSFTRYKNRRREARHADQPNG